MPESGSSYTLGLRGPRVAACAGPRRSVHDAVFRQSPPFPAGTHRRVCGRAAGRPRAAGAGRAQGPSRQLRCSGMALSDIRSFSSHPAFDLVAVADADLSRTEAGQEAVSRTYACTRTGGNCCTRRPTTSTRSTSRRRTTCTRRSRWRPCRTASTCTCRSRWPPPSARRACWQRPHAKSGSSRRWGSRSRRIRRNWPPSR